MTSTEQSQNIENSITEQSQVVNSDEATEQSQQLEGGENSKTYSEAEYRKLQAEYTKSRQELSEIKKDKELSPEDKAAIDFIKNNGFVTKEDLVAQANELARESSLKDIISSNPDLKPFESAIKKIGAVEDMDYESIIDSYGFKAKSKLAKAKSQGDVKGMPANKAKSISEMTDAEYEAFKASKGMGNRGTFA